MQEVNYSLNYNYIVSIQEFETREDDYYIRMSEQEKNVIERFLISTDLEKFIKINASEKLFRRLGE